MIGKTVGSYKISRELGEGGMGAVYLAEHTLMGKQAAVKVLLPQYCAVQEVVERFFNEAKSASMIKHPGIVDIYDFGTQEDGSAFIVMELLEGEALSDLLEREPRLANERVALLGQQMARALQAAHDLGIIHRDLKPDNIFLEPDSAAVGGERPKILDFGIAKLGGDMTESSVKTRTGAIMGTPVFMSPEQCIGAGGVDARSDVYSLGCILYMMVCGRPPFVKAGAGALIAAHISEAPEALSVYEPAVDDKLEAIIMSTLAKSPEERPQSMNALANALGGGKFTQGTGPMPDAKTRKERLDTAELFGEEAEQASPARFAKTRATGGAASTTLGSAATSAAPSATEASRGGVPKIALAGGGLLAAAVAAFLIVGGNKKQEAKAPVAAAPTIGEPQAAAPEPKPEIVEPTITAAETARTIRIELHSEPEGASVYNRFKGIKLGTTPFTRDFDRAQGELELELKFAGYESVKVSVPLQSDFSNHFTLEPIAKVSTGRKKPKDKPGTRTETTPVVKKVETDKPPTKVEPKVEKSEWGALAD